MEIGDPDGNPMYLNTETNEAKYERPVAQLPIGWILIEDADGKKMYLNTVTKEAQYEYPLPEDWMEIADPNGNPMYLNLKTYQTSYQIPGAAEVFFSFSNRHSLLNHGITIIFFILHLLLYNQYIFVNRHRNLLSQYLWTRLKLA